MRIDYRHLSFPVMLFLMVQLAPTADLWAQLHVEYHFDNEAVMPQLKNGFADVNRLYSYLEKLEREQRAIGYLAFAIDSIDIDTVGVEVYLHRGRYIDRDRLNQGLFEELRSEMERLEDTGYPFARIQVAHELDDSLLSIDARLYPGPLILMDSVVYLAGESLPQALITRHIGLRSASPYSESKLRSVDRKLKALPSLRLVRPTAVIFAGNKARAIVAVEKRNANRVDGIIGFQPDSEGKSQFTGDVKLELQNALAHLDRFSINWQRVADNTQRLDLGFRVPYLFKTSIGVTGALSQFRQDTTFNEVELRAGVFSILEKGGALELFFASKSVNDLLSDINIEKQGSSTLQYGLSYLVDRRDDPFNPKSGIRSEVGFSYGDKKVTTSLEGVQEEDQLVQWSAMFDLSYFIPLRKHSTILTRFNGFHMASETIIAKELKRIGGLSTLRGHDEQSIRASTYFIGTLEYRLITGERSFISAFTDIGTTRQQTVVVNRTEVPYGFGVGGALDTGGGILSLSYALGSRDKQAIIFNTGKVHLGFTAVF